MQRSAISNRPVSQPQRETELQSRFGTRSAQIDHSCRSALEGRCWAPARALRADSRSSTDLIRHRGQPGGCSCNVGKGCGTSADAQVRTQGTHQEKQMRRVTLPRPLVTSRTNIPPPRRRDGKHIKHNQETKHEHINSNKLVMIEMNSL